MYGAWKEKREAEKGIKEYIQASGMGLSKKEEQDFKALVLQNEETARKAFRDSNHVGKGYILMRKNGIMRKKTVLLSWRKKMSGAGKLIFLLFPENVKARFGNGMKAVNSITGILIILIMPIPLNRLEMQIFPTKKYIHLSTAEGSPLSLKSMQLLT